MTRFPTRRPSRAAIAIAGALCAVVLAGCSSAPKIVNAWHDPEYQGPAFRSVMVLGIAESPTNRRIFEDTFAMRLRDGGVEAVASHTLLPVGEQLDRDEIEAVVAERGIEAILVTRVVQVDRETSYSPGYTTVYPGTYYNDFYGFYNYSWGVYHSPGYAYNYDVVRLETSVYETSQSKLVWTAQTETVDPKSVEKESVKLADLLMQEMKTRRLL
jgi:hypothetical protein